MSNELWPEARYVTATWRPSQCPADELAPRFANLVGHVNRDPVVNYLPGGLLLVGATASDWGEVVLTFALTPLVLPWLPGDYREGDFDGFVPADAVWGRA